MTLATPITPTSTFYNKAIAPRLRMAKYAGHRLWQSKLAVIGLAIVLLYLAVAIFAPLIAPQPARQRDPYEMQLDFKARKIAPNAEHWFGTTDTGADIFYGVVWGARLSMIMGLSVTFVGALIGVFLGGLAGYFGGVIDEFVMRITDVFLAMPLLIISMAVAVADPFNIAVRPDPIWKLVNIGVALSIVWWPSYTRIVRGQVLALRENQYVEAARSVGAGSFRIIGRHILPNAISPVIVQATLDIGTVILVSAALSFIGFGPSGSGFAEWGNLVSRGQEFMLQAWWGVTIPGLAIMGFALGFNLLGDGLRDLLDPRMRT